MAKKNNRDFVVFILTHGRVRNQYTYNALLNQGYTGRVMFVLDNEDSQIEEYKNRFGENNCYVFDKLEWAKRSDEIVRGDRRAILYARNACFEIARKLGYKYFMELDDDYVDFRWRFGDKGQYLTKTPKIKNLNAVFASMLNYFKNAPITTLTMAQGGDFIGGSKNQMLRQIGLKRKAMNTFICSVDRPFEFKGRFNDDVNTYTRLGCRGLLFCCMSQCNIQQKSSQSVPGGMTEVYRETGTYIKSFTSVIVYPSGVKVTILNSHHSRIHHNVLWGHTAPKILQEKWKKNK